jgi:hypothetical protein
MTEEDSKKLFWYRVKLTALILVFVSPFVGGWLALYVFEWRPPSGNYGELVVPVRKLDWPPLETVDGEQLQQGFGRKWSFVLFAGDACAEQCRSNVYYMRQIRTLLGRDIGRLQNVLITARPLNDEMREFLLDYPMFKVIEGNRDPSLYRQFQLDGLEPVGSSARLYLVDPDQNLMMHFPPENDEYKVLDDLKKLLKLSQIG